MRGCPQLVGTHLRTIIQRINSFDDSNPFTNGQLTFFFPLRDKDVGPTCNSIWMGVQEETSVIRKGEQTYYLLNKHACRLFV